MGHALLFPVLADSTWRMHVLQNKWPHGVVTNSLPSLGAKSQHTPHFTIPPAFSMSCITYSLALLSVSSFSILVLYEASSSCSSEFYYRSRLKWPDPRRETREPGLTVQAPRKRRAALSARLLL